MQISKVDKLSIKFLLLINSRVCSTAFYHSQAVFVFVKTFIKLSQQPLSNLARFSQFWVKVRKPKNKLHNVLFTKVLLLRPFVSTSVNNEYTAVTSFFKNKILEVPKLTFLKLNYRYANYCYLLQNYSLIIDKLNLWTNLSLLYLIRFNNDVKQGPRTLTTANLLFAINIKKI